MRAEQATPADIGELTELRLLYTAEDLGALREADAAAMRERLPGWLRLHLGRNLFAYVVRADGRIAACAFLLTVEKPMSPAFINGRTGIVLNVYTRPEHRRLGYARCIMRALLADARRLALCTVELKATEAGVPLYRDAGFADDGSHYHAMKWKNPDFM